MEFDCCVCVVFYIIASGVVCYGCFVGGFMIDAFWVGVLLLGCVVVFPLYSVVLVGVLLLVQWV